MKSFRGFTLIEVMLLVAIIGILLAIAIPAITDDPDDVEDEVGISELPAPTTLEPCMKFISIQGIPVEGPANANTANVLITVTRPMRDGESAETYDVAVERRVTGESVKMKIIEQPCLLQ